MDLAGDSIFYERLVATIDPSMDFVEARPLSDSFSARTEAVVASDDTGAVHTFVLRVHNGLHHLKNPDVARHEASALQELTKYGLGTCRVLLVDDSCTHLEHAFLVTEFMEGEPNHSPQDIVDYSTKLATRLRSIHEVDAAAFSFLGPQSRWFEAKFTGQSSEYDDDAFEKRLRGILQCNWSRMLDADNVVLHGDYWSGNVLWRSDNIAAVVDWGDTALGPALSDVAYTRLELFWAFGDESVRAFTEEYASSYDTRLLALWDIAAAYRQLFEFSHWGLPADDLAEWREKHRGFAETALTRVS